MSTKSDEHLRHSLSELKEIRALTWKLRARMEYMTCAKEQAVSQARAWKQEAKTHQAIVRDILRALGLDPETIPDYKAAEAVRAMVADYRGLLRRIAEMRCLCEMDDGAICRDVGATCLCQTCEARALATEVGLSFMDPHA